MGQEMPIFTRTFDFLTWLLPVMSLRGRSVFARSNLQSRVLHTKNSDTPKRAILSKEITEHAECLSNWKTIVHRFERQRAGLG